MSSGHSCSYAVIPDLKPPRPAGFLAQIFLWIVIRTTMGEWKKKPGEGFVKRRLLQTPPFQRQSVTVHSILVSVVQPGCPNPSGRLGKDTLS